MPKTTITPDELPEGTEEWAEVPRNPPRPRSEPQRQEGMTRTGEHRVMYYQPGARDSEWIDAPRGLERRVRR